MVHGYEPNIPVSVRIAAHLHDLVAVAVPPIRRHQRNGIRPVRAVRTAPPHRNPALIIAFVGDNISGTQGRGKLMMRHISKIGIPVYVAGVPGFQIDRTLHTPPMKTIRRPVAVEAVVFPDIDVVLCRRLVKPRYAPLGITPVHFTKTEHFIGLTRVFLRIDQHGGKSGSPTGIVIEDQVRPLMAGPGTEIELGPAPVYAVVAFDISQTELALADSLRRVSRHHRGPAFELAVNWIDLQGSMANGHRGIVPGVLPFQQWIRRIRDAMLHAPGDPVLLDEIIFVNNGGDLFFHPPLLF